MLERGRKKPPRRQAWRPSRRDVLAGAASLALSGRARAVAAPPLRFGLTPVFLNNDLELRDHLGAYLRKATGRPVDLVTRRTYQEITALLISGQLDAAWICGYPFVKFADQLRLVSVPLWRGRPLYQSYLIVGAGRPVTEARALRNEVHAFSDPDSNSGFLVTSALLAEWGETPASFFRESFFTYGHRNVIRAVGSGLADSGSVDGYVWEVVREVEPELAAQTKVVRRSEWLGFPPIAAPLRGMTPERLTVLRQTFADMAADPTGREVLRLLRLDGFTEGSPALFASILAKVETLERQG
ncbi:PhnD/SsuA/transferrin family substrate-binding protein [Amorphus coralli]|uniref:substrate-binding domain-containing protein n=1 Tax=Amorphus coralli TaxID=340680 RepID=UPI0003699371